MLLGVLPHGPLHIGPESELTLFGVELQTETGNGGETVMGDVGYVVRKVGADAQNRPKGLPSGSPASRRINRKSKD